MSASIKFSSRNARERRSGRFVVFSLLSRLDAAGIAPNSPWSVAFISPRRVPGSRLTRPIRLRNASGGEAGRPVAIKAMQTSVIATIVQNAACHPAASAISASVGTPATGESISPAST